MCVRERKLKMNSQPTNAAFKSLEQKHKMLNKGNNTNYIAHAGSNRKTCKRKHHKKLN